MTQPLIFLNSQKPTSLYLTGSRVDEWVDANGTGKSVATPVSLGTTFNPVFNSALFSGRGGITFAGPSFLESAVAYSELNWSHGFTILIAGTPKSGFFAASDSATIILGAGLGQRLGIGSYGNSYQGLPLTPCVFGIVWNGAAMSFILNGEIFPLTQGSLAYGSGAFGKLQIGGIIGAGGSMAMDIAGLKVYDTNLSSDDIMDVCSDLQGIYFISDQAEPKFNLVADGNSLAVGALGAPTTAIWDGVKAVTGTTPLDLINVSTGGLETPGMIARAAATVDIHLDKSVPSKRRVLIVWEITNDLCNLSQTDTGAYNNIKAYCQARKTAGWKVIVATCLPRTQAGINTNFETYRLSINTSIRANAISEGWVDAIADVANNATIGATGAPDSTTYYADKIHLNEAGHVIAKTYITAALNSIL